MKLLLTIKEAAEACGMSQGYIRGAIRRKELPRVKHGSAVRIDVYDLKQWNDRAKNEVSVTDPGVAWNERDGYFFIEKSVGYKP